MSDTPTYGMWLRQWRKRRDLTQAELAKLAGCAVGTLRNIETDSARPSRQLAARLAHALGVSESRIDSVVAFARGTGGFPADAIPEPSRPVPPSDHPAPHAPAGGAQTNLPAQLTGLIGRTQEVAAVRALLTRPDVRLVTLTGPGGTGKTRVAVESARQLHGNVPGGVTFVDLAAIADPALVLDTIAATLGVTPTGRQPLLASLAQHLHDQPHLLVLDNFEQVLAAAPAVAELLAACPNLKLLATSRTSLGLAGEYEWPVPPLALPDRERLPPLAQLSQYEAVRLFAERARAVNPQFAITTANAPAVAEICHQLDGLPLALELAAARIKLFSPQALLQRLDRRLTFLTGGHDRPTRQQTIRNTIAWSYQLLPPAEQALFRQLGAFSGGATLAAIEAVCGDGTAESSVVFDVATLMNHSLLRRLPAGPHDTDADARFGMLETIREYALEELAADPQATAVRGRHAEYFTAVAEACAAQWSTRFSTALITQLQREHDNMRAALSWARDSHERLVALRLADALWLFWRSYGHTSEGRAWFQQLLAVDDDLADHVMMSARERALYAAAWLASDQHDFGTAAVLLEESLALRRTLGEAEGETDLFINAARQARSTGDYARATALLEETLARHRAAGASAGARLSVAEVGQVLRELGLLLREQGNFGRAAELFGEGVELHRGVGDRVGMALALLGLADVARDQGIAAEVQRYGEPSLAILRELGMQWAIGFALNSLALGVYAAGDYPQALALVEEGAALFRGLDSKASLAEVLITHGKIVLAMRDLAAAHAIFVEALQLAQILGPRLMITAAAEGLGSTLAAQGRLEPAARLLGWGAALRSTMGTPVRPVDRLTLEAAHATARAGLGDAAFEAQWAETRALPIEQLLSSLGAAGHAGLTGG